MDSKLYKYYEKLKAKGLGKKREKKILDELNSDKTHEDVDQNAISHLGRKYPDLYVHCDIEKIQSMSMMKSTSSTIQLKSIDELLERDKQREKDGFPRKIRVGRLIKPGKGPKGKVVVIPTTVEEKFIHDNSLQAQEEESSNGGQGEGDEGEVIGEEEVHAPDQPGEGPGEGEGGPHEMESNAYDLGKILTEQFELPNLKDKGKKKALTKYTYDMTDRHRGFGQILDKKETLRKIVETNIGLGNIPDFSDIDTTKFIISPKDKIYRVLSKEKDYESQAVVFFLRDYSGSMSGKPTQLVVAQHVLIYSWLLYQYEGRVENRFILHDTEAKEVNDFYTYYNSRVAGGTKVVSAFKLVNEIVKEENLASDYNIYVFYGTDGDDWDTDGKESIPEIKSMLKYTSRVGITIAEHSYGSRSKTEVEKYLTKSGLLTEKSDLIKLDVMDDSANDQRLIDGIRKLIS